MINNKKPEKQALTDDELEKAVGGCSEEICHACAFYGDVRDCKKHRESGCAMYPNGY